MKHIKVKPILLLVSMIAILTVSVGGTIAWLSTKESDVNNTFQPGELYVSVTDSVSGKVKSNVVIKNTSESNVDGYIRAAIVAAWYNDDGEIVAAWDASSDGTFVGLTGSDWTKCSDGFYYYTKRVAPNTATGSALFTSYTVKSTPPVEGAHLEMSILAQITQADPYSSWSAAWNGLTGSTPS